MGKATDIFPKLKTIKISKPHTRTALDVILERINQFSNAQEVHLEYRVFNDTLSDIRRLVPHTVYEYTRIGKRENTTNLRDVIFLDYHRVGDHSTLKVKKYN